MLSKILEYVGASILCTGLAIGFATGVSVNQQEINAIESSYKLTTFDYILSAPSENQVTTFSGSDEAVNMVFPAYNFDIQVKGKKPSKISLLLANDLTNYSISFVNDDLLLEGKFDANGIMLDENASKKLGVQVGDKVSYSLANSKIDLSVAGIYRACSYPKLDKGIGLAYISDETLNRFINKPTYDMVFIRANNLEKLNLLVEDYIPMGLLIPEDRYINNYKENTVCPPGITDEEWTEQIRVSYNEYKTTFLSKSYPEYVHDKLSFGNLVSDRIESRVRSNKMMFSITATIIPLFYIIAIIGIAFINYRSDYRVAKKGESDSHLYLVNLLTSILCIVFSIIGVGCGVALAGHLLNLTIAQLVGNVVAYTAPLLLVLIAGIITNILIVKSVYKGVEIEKQKQYQNQNQGLYQNNHQSNPYSSSRYGSMGSYTDEEKAFYESLKRKKRRD